MTPNRTPRDARQQQSRRRQLSPSVFSLLALLVLVLLFQPLHSNANTAPLTLCIDSGEDFALKCGKKNKLAIGDVVLQMEVEECASVGEEREDGAEGGEEEADAQEEQTEERRRRLLPRKNKKSKSDKDKNRPKNKKKACDPEDDELQGQLTASIQELCSGQRKCGGGLAEILPEWTSGCEGSGAAIVINYECTKSIKKDTKKKKKDKKDKKAKKMSKAELMEKETKDKAAAKQAAQEAKEAKAEAARLAQVAEQEAESKRQAKEAEEKAKAAAEKARLEEEKRAKLAAEAAQRAKEEDDRKAKAEAERKAQEAAEAARKAAEEADRKAKAEEDARRAREEQERQAKKAAEDAKAAARQAEMTKVRRLEVQGPAHQLLPNMGGVLSCPAELGNVRVVAATPGTVKLRKRYLQRLLSRWTNWANNWNDRGFNGWGITKQWKTPQQLQDEKKAEVQAQASRIQESCNAAKNKVCMVSMPVIGCSVVIDYDCSG